MSEQTVPLMAEGATVPFVVLDVFTNRPFSGNPLAVILDAEALSTTQMQRIARQFNLSETAFPLRPSGDERQQGADYRLRIFTPEVELPFAGHPSVGSAWWLHQIGRVGLGTAHQQCGAGLLPVDVTETSATLTGGPPTVSSPVDPAPALAAVGLELSDAVEAEVHVASTGLAYAVLYVADSALARCEPDLAVLRREFSYPQPATGVYVVAWDAASRHARARMFAGDIGSPEDPATGSAALALGADLCARGAFDDGTATFTIAQGVEMGRPSDLTVTCDISGGKVTRLQVSGGAVLVSEGRIAVPQGA